MLAQLRSHRPSPSMVVALVALFLALGGSSYAALKLKANSISSTHIKNGQVKGVDLGKASVDTSKVADGKLLAADFAGGQLPAGARGPQGAQGATGAPGSDGADGADGFDGAGLLAQARCDDCPVDSGDALAPEPIPLTDSEWTQIPDEGNALFIEVSWSPPPVACTAAPVGGVPQQAGARVAVFLDGDEIGRVERDNTAGGATDHIGPVYVFAPPADDPHAVTAMVGDNCTGPEDARVNDIKVDVASLLG